METDRFSRAARTRIALEGLVDDLPLFSGPSARVEPIKAPAGLDIGAGDSGAVAISIMAEIVQIWQVSADMMSISEQ